MDRKKIGARLARLRGARPREEVALAVGVTAQAIYNYEMGERIPTDEVKIKLARFFRTTVQDLFYT